MNKMHNLYSLDVLMKHSNIEAHKRIHGHVLLIGGTYGMWLLQFLPRMQL